MNIKTHFGKSLVAIAVAIFSFALLISFAFAAITSLALTAPMGGQDWSGIQDVTWTQTGGVAGDTVSILLSTDSGGSFNEVIATGVEVADLSYSWDTTSTAAGPLADGSTYRVRITDGAIGLDSSSSDFTVDNTPPTFGVVDGTEPGPVMTDTINVTTADVTSGVASQEYGFSTDAVCDASDTYGNVFTSGVNFDIMGNNTDYLCVTATDNAGNIAYEAVGQLNTDNTAPTVLSYTFSGVADDAFFNPNTTPDISIDITADEIVTWATVRIINTADASEYKTKSPGLVDTTVNVTWDGLVTAPTLDDPASDDQYELLYTITDLAGNTSGTLAGPLTPYTITIDTVDPTMTSVVATTIEGAGDTIVVAFSEDVDAVDGDWTNGGELTFESPIGATLDVTNATFAFNDTTNVLTVTLDEAIDEQWLKNGSVVRATPVADAVKDLADNSLAAQEDSVAVSGDLAAPTVALTYDIDRQVKDADTIVITAAFNEEMDNTPQIAIAAVGDGSLLVTNMTIGTDRTVWTYSWDVPTGPDDDGLATITIAGEDLAGNTMNDATNTRVIDNTAPTVDTFTKPMSDTVYTADTILTFTATDSGSGTGPVCTYSLNSGSDVTTACSVTDLVVASLAEGRNTIEITVTDEAGNTDSGGPISFVYDTDGILTVDDTSGNNPDFATIQGAIDAWVTGITQIHVAAGAYSENVTVDQDVTIQGIAGAVLTAPGGTAILVTVDGVTIDSMTIENPTAGYGIVGTDISNLTITNNTIQNIGTTLASGPAQGVYLKSSASDVTNIDVSNNTITNIGNLSLVLGSGSSAKGIFLGDSSPTTNDFDGVVIDNNNISNVFASGSAWPAGRGAYGILTNHSATIDLQITNNTIDTLEGLWAHGVGLENDTPNAVVTGNTISNLIDHKAGTDAVAIFAESNPSIATITVSQNKMSNSAIGVALHPTLAATAAGVFDASENWWGDPTGPYNATANSAGLGVDVWPSINDGYTSYVKFSPFYNSAAMTNLVSVDPIATFNLDFSPDPQAVNNPVTLTVTARDALGYLVVNDSTTQVKLDADSGASFGVTPVTMEVDGDVATTITNTIVGTVNVTAEEWPGGPATGVGTVEFIAGSDVTAPAISNIQATAITTTGVTITWDTDEASSSQVEYGATSLYGTLTPVDATMVTSHSVTITGLTAGVDYHFRVISLDASSNVGTSGDNTFTTVNVDNTPPTITLLGQNPVTLTVGDTYVEVGATANDDVDGDVATSIVIDSSAVNMAVAGTYVVTYNVSDSVPNAAVQENRTVIVTDPAVTPVIPTITLNGTAIVSSYTVTEATARFASGLQFDTTSAASVTVNGSSVTPAATVTAVLQADAITVGAHTYNVIVTSATGDTANITVPYLVTADPTADTTAPVITLLGVNPQTLTVGDTYTELGATANDDVDGDVATSIVIDSSAVNMAVAGTYVVTYNVSDSVPNAAIEETRTVIVNAAFDDTASLAVTGIDAVKTYATADDTYANGWSWKYYVTVPTGETQFQMKFSDFLSGANSIAAASNIRFYTAQASANATDATAITILNAGDPYSTAITLDSDLASGTAGRQIEVIVEMKVPVGSAGGSYSGSYGVLSNTI